MRADSRLFIVDECLRFPPPLLPPPNGPQPTTGNWQMTSPLHSLFEICGFGGPFLKLIQGRILNRVFCEVLFFSFLHFPPSDCIYLGVEMKFFRVNGSPAPHSLNKSEPGSSEVFVRARVVCIFMPFAVRQHLGPADFFANCAMFVQRGV